MPSLTQKLGAAAEQRAAEYLRDQGFEIVARNWRRRAGELDLVAVRGQLLVIAEVRTRSHSGFGGAAASVTRLKQRRIVRAAQQLLQQNPALRSLVVRFDLLVVAPTGAPQRIEWIQHAFEA